MWAHCIPLLRNYLVIGLFRNCSASRDALIIIKKQRPAACLGQTQAEQQSLYWAVPLCVMQYVVSREWNSSWLTAASRHSPIVREKDVYLHFSQRGRKFEFLTPTSCFTNLESNSDFKYCVKKTCCGNGVINSAGWAWDYCGIISTAHCHGMWRSKQLSIKACFPCMQQFKLVAELSKGSLDTGCLSSEC